MNFVKALEQTSSLARIVADEAHLLLDTSFRPAYADLIQQVATFRCPRLALTATCPPTLEEHIKAKLHRPQADVIRGNMDRSNLIWGKQFYRLFKPRNDNRLSNGSHRRR
ncbi:MAG: DEAD/DEAH box helicase [Spirochaetota bacterium]